MFTLPEKLRFGMQDLFDMIRETDIDLTLWGREETKTATHLIDEVNDEECTLELIDGILYRNMEVVSITVYSPDQKLLLREQCQIFNDGRIRVRNLPHNCSVAEKLKEYETPSVANIRAFKEELNILINPDQIDFIITLKETRPSDSYPGIYNRQITNVFETTLTEEQFNPEGYIEVQEDKKTYFTWTNHIPSQPE